MPHYPKPFFRKPRRLWYVQIDGRQVNLGPVREAAFKRYYELMAHPKSQRQRYVPSDSVAAICDHFLEWVEQHRSPETYEWYRYRLQRFVEQHPELSTAAIRPYHVETWADSYALSVTSRRNYLRSVKRCLKWATKMGYIDSNPIAHLEVPSAECKETYVSAGRISATACLRPRSDVRGSAGRHLRDRMPATGILEGRSSECGFGESKVGLR